MPRREKRLITGKKEMPIILVPLITLQKNNDISEPVLSAQKNISSNDEELMQLYNT
jgi:hypothetical protein